MSIARALLADAPVLVLEENLGEAVTVAAADLQLRGNICPRPPVCRPCTVSA
ncbi:hypothetical protein ACWCOT_30945 [Nonomuraea bangladeshensis]